MPTIAGIQNEIRGLQAQLEKMQMSLTEIENNLENIKQADTSQAPADYYETARKNAPRLPFSGHPLEKEQAVVRKTDYILTLCYCLTLNQSQIQGGLTFVEWLRQKLAVKKPLNDLYLQALKTRADFFDKLDGFSPQQKDSLMLDCLLIAGLNGELAENSARFLADLARMLGQDEEQLIEKSAVARVILEQGYARLSWQEIGYLEYKGTRKYAYYITPEVLKTFKRKIKTLPISSTEPNSFIRIINNRSMVEKGKKMATYRSINGVYKEIKAPESGVCYSIKHRDNYYIIVTQEGDSKQKIIHYLETIGSEEAK